MNNYTFGALPQTVARLEEKVDAIAETLGRLLEKAESQTVRPSVEEMVGIKQAAQILHLSVSRVHTLVQQGSVPSYKPGRNLMFLPSELHKWISEGRRSGRQSVEEQLESLTKGMRHSVKGRAAI